MPLEMSQTIVRQLRCGERPSVPGLIRASFGIYNTLAEVDAFLGMLDRIRHGDYEGEYLQDSGTGTYAPRGTGGAMVDESWSSRSCT